MKCRNTMKIVHFFVIYAATCTVVFGLGDMGKGRWSTLSVDPCEGEDASLECNIGVVRRKYNRSLDVFDVTLECDKDIDDSIGTVITICKHVDGGCKEWQVLSDDSVPRFSHKYAESNIKRAFELAKLDPLDFPIAAGKHSMENFTLDYCEFPRECMYGEFKAVAYLLQAGNKLACLQATVVFDEDTEGYECD